MISLIAGILEIIEKAWVILFHPKYGYVKTRKVDKEKEILEDKEVISKHEKIKNFIADLSDYDISELIANIIFVLSMATGIIMLIIAAIMLIVTKNIPINFMIALWVVVLVALTSNLAANG